MADRKKKKKAPKPKAAPSLAAAPDEAGEDYAGVDAVFVCLDVSGSIRGCDRSDTGSYPGWVAKDIVKIVPRARPAAADGSPPTPAKVAAVEAPCFQWILWGSAAVFQDSLEDVVSYLDSDECLGGTEPLRFMQLLPQSGVIDLHVYTDGEIGECDVRCARDELEKHAGLKIRRVVINYVNKHLDSMNVGLSAIFDGYVMDMHRTRVTTGEQLHQFDAAPLGSAVTIREIVDDHIALGKTEAEMTKGIHYLAQRFANADKKTRQEIRRLVRERADAVNREFRTKTMTPEEEEALLAAVGERRWLDARKPFIGHAVHPSVKLVQAYCQKFLNETKQGALIRISAYAPMQLKSKGSGGNQFDVEEDVLLDHIMYLGLGREAIVVVPALLPAPESPRLQPRVPTNHIKSALSFGLKVNYDNTFGLDTLFQLRDQQMTDGVADAEGQPNQAHVLDQLSARAHGEPAPEAATLSSSASSFGVNPFTRQQMECVLLVPAAADGLAADRLAQVDAWNAHMMSRFVRSGRTMPSVALTLALVLENAFSVWEDGVRPEDKAEADKLKAVCRRYVSRMRTPLTFTVGLPVVVEGTFATAARLACAVLREGTLDPGMPADVLTQFWATMPDSEEAAKVWNTLRVYAGLPEDAPFPKDLHRTLLALVAGAQYSKSARDLKLREKKGLAYSVRMYNKRLDQLVSMGCHPQRLRDEEKAVRKDLLGVPTSEPILCVHGVDADKCAALDPKDEVVDTICQQTCRPTLLNPRTMDMWYVGQPRDTSELAQQSFHKAMWQLVRKRTKGKRPRHDFPPKETEFAKFVNHRVRAAALNIGGKGGRLVATESCARLRQDIDLTYFSYVKLKQDFPKMTRKRFIKALRLRRDVCAFGPCCEYIRAAVSERQLQWIDEHATHAQVAGDEDVLGGRVSYRQAA